MILGVSVPYFKTICVLQGFTFSAADTTRASRSSGSFSSFSTTSTRRSSDASAADACKSQSVAKTSPHIPSLLDSLPCPEPSKADVPNAEMDQHAPSDAPPGDPPPSDPPPSQVRATSSTVESKVSVWHGGFPPLIEIMSIMTSILEGLMVCPSVYINASPSARAGHAIPIMCKVMHVEYSLYRLSSGRHYPVWLV